MTTMKEDLQGKMIDRLLDLVNRVSYRDESYIFKIDTTEGMLYPYIQIRHFRPDCNTGEMGWGAGGKAYVTPWATDSEVFQIMFGLAKAYEEHEVREFFKVDGKRPFGPHISTDALISVADELDVRPSP